MANYQEAIVSFIDVLGFRNLIETESPDKIIEIFNQMKFLKVYDDELDEEPLAYSYTLSDAIVRVRPIDNKYRYGTLFQELSDLQIAQMELINKGIFIRGGVTIGEIHIGENGLGPLFGPAFNRAYELETGYAVHPRIVLDSNTLSRYMSDPKLQAEHHDFEHDSDYVLSCISNHSNTGWFVDYLGLDAGSFDHGYCGLYETFKNHHEFIQSNLATISDKKIRDKYVWLAKYHNNSIANYTSMTWNKKQKADFLDEYGIDQEDFFNSVKFDERFL